MFYLSVSFHSIFSIDFVYHLNLTLHFVLISKFEFSIEFRTLFSI